MKQGVAMRSFVGSACALVLLAACGEDGTMAPSITALNPSTHEAYFPIAGGKHQGAACDACHGKFDTFQQFACTDCHEHQQAAADGHHAGMDGYAYDSGLCLNCHPRGNASDPPADHDLHFPVGAGAVHEGVACSSCHLTAADRTQVSCSDGSCHAAPDVTPAHALVSDFAAQTAGCLRCHADGQVNRVAKHLFGLGPGTAHVSTNATRGACLTCHPAMREDKPFGANFQVKTCVDGSCHPQADTTASHQGVGGFAYETPRCTGCHPTGSAAVDHENRFPIGAGTLHDVACSSCHQDATNLAAVTCSDGSCHPAAAMRTAHPSSRVGGFQNTTAMCLRCHPGTPVFRVARHPGRSGEGSFNDEDHRSRCLSCHTATRSDRPYPAADFTRADCSRCHDGGGGDD